MRRLAPLLLLAFAGLGAPEAARGGEPALAWRLHRSDLVVYRRWTVTVADGAEKRSGAKLVTVHGHDLRDAGQYSPASPVRDDLYQLLAFRLPAPGHAQEEVKLDWTPMEAAPIRLKGTLRLVTGEDGREAVEGTWTFKSRGRAGRDQRWWYDDGRATTRLVFDRGEGVVQEARLVIAFDREDLAKKGKEAFSHHEQTYAYERQAVERMRPPDFQARVDAAIEKGLKHLRSLQEDDGNWKPHGGYIQGTTGLAVLTLVACGVPRDDPAVRRGLDAIFAKDPERTYEQAVCLMAVDRAWMPADEQRRLEAGHAVEKPVRDLPPERMAWARRVARALEEGASSPGSWGYPPKGNTLLRFDTSNTQYAALGLRAAVHLGYEVSENTWLGFVRHCKLVRERKGPKGRVSLVRQGQAIPDEALAHEIDPVKVEQVTGYRYSTLEGHDHVDAAMSCAAVTILLVARHHLQRMESRRLDARALKEFDELLGAGWAWLDAHWAMDRHPAHPGGRWYWYYLYSLERACVLDGIKRVGGKDWYYEGAMQLLHRQGSKKGDWNDPRGDATAPTCFALLFLRRGTSPLGAPITGR